MEIGTVNQLLDLKKFMLTSRMPIIEEFDFLTNRWGEG